MAPSQLGTSSQLVLRSNVNGLTVIPQPTVLTRLNYFDGKFLRASDLQQEQEYLRMLVEISNLGGGMGVVNGFDTTLGGGDQINLGPGLAIDGAGRLLMLPTGTSFGAQDLINASRRVMPVAIAGIRGSAAFAECAPDVISQPVTAASGQDFYLMTIGHAEALCGEEDVYGRLCEAACATGTDRPHRVEGVVVRALPFRPTTPLPTSASIALSGTHLRSQLASAFFADEALLVASLISKSGLALGTWCLGAHLGGGQDVPLAVFVRSGTTTLFLDAWTARRERMEAPAKRYWAWKMMMRPWDVYLGQILQFQCQLHDLILAAPAPGGPSDPCKPDIQLLSNAAQLLDEIKTKYTTMVASLPQATSLQRGVGTLLPGGITRLDLLRADLSASLQGLLSRPTNRVLINGGIVELPSAGYLPVDIGSVTVNDQVRKLVGEGLDLRFCVVRPDYVAHALEEAEHMERISLLTGLDHPDAKPKVDILVPNGQIVQTAGATPGTGVSGQVQMNPTAAGSSLAIRGAGREERLGSGGWDFAFADYTAVPTTTSVKVLAQAMSAAASADPAATQTFVNIKTTTPTAFEARWSAPDFLSNARVVSGGAIRYLGTLSPTPTRTPGNVFNPGVIRANQPGAFWISFHLEKNPLLLSAGDSTTVMLRHTLVSPGTTAASGLNDNQYQGTLIVTNVVRTASGETTLTGTFSGTLFTSRPAPTGAGLATDLSPMNATLIVQVDRPAGQDLRVNVSYTLLSTGTGQLLTAIVSGSPPTVTAEVRLVDANHMAAAPYATAKMTVDPTIFGSGNSDQALARLALPILAAGLQDKTFAAVAERKLFPPPAPDVGEQIVQPTLDWVLFQRRREAECRTAPAVVTVPARVYQLYSVLAPDTKTLDAIRAALMSKPTGDLKPYLSLFKAVDQPQFAGGASALATPAANVLADWQSHGPGNTLEWAGIADRATENPFTSQGRLSSVEQAVAPVSAPDPQLAGELMPAIPTELDVPSTDGIIVLITQQRTVCHTVYRVKLGVESLNMFARLAKGDVPTATAVLGAALPRFLTRLGDARFNPGSPAIVASDDIVKPWTNMGFAAPLRTVVVTSDAATDVGDAATRASQAATIGSKIEAGSTLKVVADFAVPSATIPKGDCTVIDIILPTLRHRVVAVRTITAQVRKIGLFVPGGPVNAGFVLSPQDFTALINDGVFADLGNADFDPGTANLLAGPAKQLSSLPNPPWRPNAMQTVQTVVTLFDGKTMPERGANLVAQAGKIPAAVGAAVSNAPILIQQPAAPPGGGQALTLLLFELP